MLAGRRPFEGQSVWLLSPPSSCREPCRGPTRDVLEALVSAGGGRCVEGAESSAEVVVSCCGDHLEGHQASLAGAAVVTRDTSTCVVPPTFLLDAISAPPETLNSLYEGKRGAVQEQQDGMVMMNGNGDSDDAAKRRRVEYD